MNTTTLSHIWNVIVTSNTFNFLIFLLIFAWIFKKINIKGIIDSLQAEIIKVLEASKKTKEEAQNDLLMAEKAVENLGEELNEIFEDASKSAKVISEKILSEAQKQVESIEKNATKVIDAEEKLLISKLTKSTSKASVEVAKAHIKNVLVETPSLQDKYIDECIEELDKLNW